MKFERTLSEEDIREQRARVFDRILNTITEIDGFDNKTPSELFSSKSEISAFVSRISEEQYISLISGANGVLRDKSRDSWGFDGDGVTISGQGDAFPSAFFPDQSSKVDLISRSLEVAKEMVGAGRSLSEVAYLLAAVIVETHPFADGNGRTGRVVYELLANGYDSAKLQTLLAEEGRDSLNVSVPKRDLHRIFYGQMNDGGIRNIFASDNGSAFAPIVFPDNIPNDAKTLLIERARGDTGIMLLGVVALLENHPELHKENYLDSRNILIFERLVSDLTPETTEELIASYWHFKKKYTEVMIDVFKHPEKPEYQIEKEGATCSVLEVWKEQRKMNA